MFQRTIIVATILSTMITASRAHGQCEERWTAGFGVPGVNGEVLTLAVFDDGTGPALYVGGRFTSAGDVAAGHIARWNGSSWSALGDGFDGEVRALIVFDNGDGPALYAGGSFTASGDVTLNFVAKWDGFAWSPLATGLDDSVSALAVFDEDAEGPNPPGLFVGGEFLTAGGVTVNHVARWSNGAWSAVGTGMNDEVRTLTSYDADAAGPGLPALYAAGDFTGAGSVEARHAARWNGTAWSALLSGTDGPLDSMVVVSNVDGELLYVGGSFTTAGGVSASNTALWDSTAWGAAMQGGVDAAVHAMATEQDARSSTIYVAGEFTAAGGMPARCVAAWTGAGWTSLGSGLGDHRYVARANALALFNDGMGPALYVGGRFVSAGNVSASCIAKWQNGVWSALGSGKGLNDSVSALAVFDDGLGPALYAGGGFLAAGDTLSGGIARWDGVAWSSVGGGLGDSHVIPQVFTLAVWDDGTESALYVGGHFTDAAGVGADYIARWDGIRWLPIGGGPDNDVYALCVFDDGTGSSLYAGGLFRNAGGAAVNGIARWDGTSWTPLDVGVNGRVYALAVYDDGTGPALYAGGDLTLAGGASANFVARWQNGAWSSLATGVGGQLFPAIYALSVFNGGSGPELVAAGRFSTAGEVSAKNVAAWNGAAWSPLGSGFTGAAPEAYAMTAAERDGEAVLYVGGSFQRASGTLVNGIVDRHGGYWYPMNGGLSAADTLPYVFALTMFDDGTGPALYVGGYFSAAGGIPAVGLARWACAQAAGDLNCDGTVDNFDINPFVLALTDPAGYDALYPECDRTLADVNGDGAVDNFDINPFVGLLTGG